MGMKRKNTRRERREKGEKREMKEDKMELDFLFLFFGIVLFY